MTYNSKYLFSLWVFGVQLNFGDQLTHIWGLAACQMISGSLSWDQGNLALLCASLVLQQASWGTSSQHMLLCEVPGHTQALLLFRFHVLPVVASYANLRAWCVWSCVEG